MEISPLTLSILLLYSFLWGGIIGVINDVNKVIRVILFGNAFFERYKKTVEFFRLNNRPQKSNSLDRTFLNILIFIQDFFALIIAAVGLILLNYYYNDGYFRLFTFIAIFIGFFIYYFTIGKLVTVILEPLAFFLRCIIISVIRIIILPLRLLLKSIITLIFKLFVKCKKSIEKNNNLRYNRKRREQIIRLSGYGFFNE
jgi:hypothetical protein